MRMAGRVRAHWVKWRESGAGIMIAILFWTICVLLAVLAVAMAAAKGNPFTDALLALGTLGQVFFAWMLWGLSKRQFEHTRSVDAFQRKFATYQLRLTPYESLKSLWPSLRESEISREAVQAYRGIAPTILQLYPPDIADEARDLSRALTALTMAQGRNRSALQMDLEAPVGPEELAALRRKVEEHGSVLLMRMQVDLLLWHDEMPEERRLNERDIAELRDSIRDAPMPGA